MIDSSEELVVTSGRGDGAAVVGESKAGVDVVYDSVARRGASGPWLLRCKRIKGLVRAEGVFLTGSTN